MSSYLTLAEFRALSLMPASDVDELEARVPGFIAGQCEVASADLDALLRKRYDAPFTSPYPVKVRAWCARIVTRVAFLKRGIDPTDPQWAAYDEDAKTALAEAKEAADSVTGLYDLPLRSDTKATGLRAPAPLAYTETSPYVQQDVQAAAAYDEDASGEGSYA